MVARNPNISINITERTKEILGLENVYYTINRDYLYDYIEYVNDMMCKTSDTSTPWEDIDLLNFLNIYKIEFSRILLDHQENQEFITGLRYLIQYGLNFDTFADIDYYKGLLAKDDSPSKLLLIEIYNIISATKLYYVGMLNELAIYARFSYFHIHRYVATLRDTTVDITLIPWEIHYVRYL